VVACSLAWSLVFAIAGAVLSVQCQRGLSASFWLSRRPESLAPDVRRTILDADDSLCMVGTGMCDPLAFGLRLVDSLGVDDKLDCEEVRDLVWEVFAPLTEPLA